MAKTVLALWHAGGKGKTGSIREFATLLLKAYPDSKSKYPIPASVPAKGDFRLVIEVKGTIVGVESQGDPKTNLKSRLLDLADNYNCDVIICSSRTKGETVKAVENLQYNRGFQTIWTSTYQVEGSHNRSLLNSLKGRHILEVLQTLGLF